MQITPVSYTIMNSFWDLCQERFRANLTQQQFSTWIKPLVFDESDNHVHILAPNHFVMDWVREKFSENIDSWAQEYFTQPVSISYALGKKTSCPQVRCFTCVHNRGDFACCRTCCDGHAHQFKLQFR